MADAKDMAMQIVRENYRGVVGRVYEKDGEIFVEAPAGTALPADVKGFMIRLIDKPLPGRAPTAGAASSSTSSAKTRLDAARAENERLRQERAAQLSPEEQHELEQLEAENARLRGA